LFWFLLLFLFSSVFLPKLVYEDIDDPEYYEKHLQIELTVE